jgi:hypothetical protein
VVGAPFVAKFPAIRARSDRALAADYATRPSEVGPEDEMRVCDVPGFFVTTHAHFVEERARSPALDTKS